MALPSCKKHSCEYRWLTFDHSGVFADRKADDLFLVDTGGDASISKKFPAHIKKGLTADKIIAARSAVPAVAGRKRPGDKTTDGTVAPKRPRTTPYVSHRELARLRMIADGQHDSTIDVVDATHDPWAAPAAEPVEKAEDPFSFLPKKEETKAPKSMKQKPISLAANGKAIPAIRKPDGGHSYNPRFDEYEDRLNSMGQKELAAEQARLDEAKADLVKAEAALKSAAEADAADARAELSEWDEDSAWEGFESGGEELNAVKKKPTRKTQAQRNKIRRRKEEERRLKHEAAMRRQKDQEQKIASIARSIEEKSRALELARMELSDDSEEGDDTELRRRQLGKFRLPEKDLELVLPDELEDSLRLLKPEGNLLKDRYRSMIVRGRMESRRKIPFRKQKKVKVTEKWNYKDFKLH